jgi:hypothetical protein
MPWRIAEENGDWLPAHTARVTAVAEGVGPGACPYFPWASLVQTAVIARTTGNVELVMSCWATAGTASGPGRESDMVVRVDNCNNRAGWLVGV